MQVALETLVDREGALISEGSFDRSSMYYTTLGVQECLIQYPKLTGPSLLFQVKRCVNNLDTLRDHLRAVFGDVDIDHDVLLKYIAVAKNE